MAYARLVFGGHSLAGSSSTDPVIEEWSCSLALIDTGTTITDADVDDVAAQVEGWFTDTRAGIAATERLEWLKLNHFDVVTGHQITDPTMMKTWSPGVVCSVTPSNPITNSYRISLDDGTRNRRARGGFYVPRVAIPVQANGRFPTSQITDATDNAAGLFVGLHSVLSGRFTVAVYSKRAGGLFDAARFRISDVPDNISRRKNAMQPAYHVHAL